MNSLSGGSEPPADLAGGFGGQPKVRRDPTAEILSMRLTRRRFADSLTGKVFLLIPTSNQCPRHAYGALENPQHASAARCKGCEIWILFAS